MGRLLSYVLAMSLLLLMAGLVRPRTVGYGQLEEAWRGEVEQLSWSPRAFLFKNFLLEEECQHIINIASPRMKDSAVLDNKSGQPKKSGVRTSTGTFFDRGHDVITSRIEKRVAAVTMIPVEHQEGLQVLHYVDGQKYEAHYDYFHDDVNTRLEHGGQRIVTVLMYLSTPEEGGETVFPDADKKASGPGYSDCALKGLANKPVKGDALMFYSLTPDGKKDPSSLHGSCPTLKGDKWSATKWIHVAPFGLQQAPPVGKHGCQDAHSNCYEWAYLGECTKNPSYMLQSCRASCNVCDPANNNIGRVTDIMVKPQ